MELTGMTRQIIDFQKASVDQAFSGAIALQDYSENLLDTFLSQTPWITEESKKPIHDSVQMLKSVTEEYQKAVHQGFAEFEKMIG
jgi:hypothetical protein